MRHHFALTFTTAQFNPAISTRRIAIKKAFLLSALLLCGGALMMPVRPAVAQNPNIVATSELAGMPLPTQTVRIDSADVPKEINDTLQSMMTEGGPGAKRGRTEVLAWSGNGYSKARAKEWKGRIATALRKAGWEYKEGGKIEGARDVTMVSALKTAPTRQTLIGFWVPADDGLVLAWTEMHSATANGNTGIVPPAPDEAIGTGATDEDVTTQTPDEVPAQSASDVADTVPAGTEAPVAGTVIEVSEGQFVVNVAKNLPAPRVTFPKLAPLPGKVRGHVFGTDGKPLKGAVIGVASTAVGGAETSITAKTDARGYYEAMVPFGGARFYSSGYGMDYGEGRLAMGLTAADGDADVFASTKGHVENWILLPYGIADRAGVQDNPQYLNNYFGGSVTLEYLDENSGIAGPKGIPFGSTVEVTLIPKGVLMDGSKGQVVTIRKVVQDNGERRLYVNNIPVGTYTISARMVRGGRGVPLNLRETGPDRATAFGLEPKQGQGSAQLMFRPYSARVESATAGKGNWKEVDINIMQ